MSIQCVYTIYTQNVYTPIHTTQNNQQRSLSMKQLNKKLPSEHLSDFLNFISETRASYNLCLQELKNQEQLTQDYLHSLELDGLKCEERSKVATKLAINRKDRRYFKDRIEEYQPLIDFASDPQNKKIIDKLTQVLGEMRKQERYHNNRTYYPRILKEPKKN